jgi:hypothetical protein
MYDRQVHRIVSFRVLDFFFQPFLKCNGKFETVLLLPCDKKRSFSEDISRRWISKEAAKTASKAASIIIVIKLTVSAVI